MRRHRVCAAFALAGLLLSGRAAVALANANAYWNPAFNDPGRVDITDISGLIAKTVLYGDPMDEVRRALGAVLHPSGRVAIASTPRLDEGPPRAHRPRAPPTT